jgi:hypothetical protein
MKFLFRQVISSDLSLDQLTNQVIVLMGAGELLLLVKPEYCKVAWHAGIGIN